MTDKKIVTLADLEGRKVRVGGNLQQQTLAALGGIPVTVTPPEICNAMQNGTLDGTVFHLPSIHSCKLNDLVKYGTDNLNLGVFTSCTATNRDLFDEMPEDLQQILTHVGMDLLDEEAADTQAMSNQYREAFKAQGVDLHDLDPEVIAEVTTRLTPIREDWAALYEKRNLPAQKVVDAWVAALKAHAGA